MKVKTAATAVHCLAAPIVLGNCKYFQQRAPLNTLERHQKLSLRFFAVTFTIIYIHIYDTDLKTTHFCVVFLALSTTSEPNLCDDLDQLILVSLLSSPSP